MSVILVYFYCFSENFFFREVIYYFIRMFSLPEKNENVFFLLVEFCSDVTRKIYRNGIYLGRILMVGTRDWPRDYSECWLYQHTVGCYNSDDSSRDHLRFSHTNRSRRLLWRGCTHSNFGLLPQLEKPRSPNQPLVFEFPQLTRSSTYDRAFGLIFNGR